MRPNVAGGPHGGLLEPGELQGVERAVGGGVAVAVRCLRSLQGSGGGTVAEAAAAAARAAGASAARRFPGVVNAVRFAKVKAAGKPRVLALANAGSEAAAGAARVVELKRNDAAAPYSVKESWGLATLRRVELRPANGAILLHFEGSGGTAAYLTEDSDARDVFVGGLVLLARRRLRREIQVAGAEPTQLAGWVARAKAELLVGVDSDEDDDQTSSPVATGGGVRALISSEEEQVLEEFLEEYDVDLGSAAAFEERLESELEALEAANVHAVLESSGVEAAEVDQLAVAALHQLDDLEAWLATFNVKLTHMRIDIQAIEDQNNQLETTSRNCATLLESMEALLGAFELPPGVEDTLLIGPLEGPHLAQTVAAADSLATALAKLSPEALPPGTEDMRAVVEGKAELVNLRRAFTERAVRSLVALLSNVATEAEVPRRGRGLVRSSDMTGMHARLARSSPLVAAVAKLDREALRQLRSSYCLALNSTLRREVREMAAEARAAVQAGSASGDNKSHEGFAAFVAAAVPLLEGEVDFASHYLVFLTMPSDGDGDAEGSGGAPGEDKELSSAAEALLTGVHEDFTTLLNWIARADPVLCVPMLGALASPRSSAGSGAASVRPLLATCEARLRELLSSFVVQRTAALEHVECAKAGRPGVISESTKLFSVLARTDTLARAEQAGPSADASGKAAAVVHTALAKAYFAAVERVAALEPKHRDEVIFQNYSAFVDNLPGAGGVLAAFVDTARERSNAARERYVAANVEKFFPKVVALTLGIDKLLEGSISPEEVPFQQGLAKAEVRKIIKASVGGRHAEHAIKDMHKRVQKHLGNDTPLQLELWDQCRAHFLGLYGRLEDHMQRCYNNEDLDPSTRQMEELFKLV